MFVATPESTQIVNVSLSEADILKVPELPGRPRNAVAALRAWRHGACLAAMGPVNYTRAQAQGRRSCGYRRGVRCGGTWHVGVGNPLVLVGTVQKR